MLRKLCTLTLIAALVFTVSGYDRCSQVEADRNLAFAKDIASAFRASQKYVGILKPDLAKRYNLAIDIADNLISAVRSKDGITAATLVRDLLPVFEETAAAFATNEKALAAFALADIGLHVLVNHFMPELPDVATAPGKDRAPLPDNVIVLQDAAARFKQKQIWGCAYRPDKCEGDIQKVKAGKQ